MNRRPFISNMLNFLFHSKKKNMVRNVTQAKARELQKHYISNKCEVGTPYSQPYVEIAQQLSSSKSEIFRAAVFYLKQIALNDESSAEPILAVLQNYGLAQKRSKEDEIFLSEVVNKIKFKYKK